MEEKDVKKEKKQPVEDKKTENKKETTKVKKEDVKKETKTVENKKKTESKKDNKKKMNSSVIIAVVIALVVIALIIYMGLMSDSPKKAVNDMFNEAKTQLSEENIFSSLIQGEDGEKEAQKLLFENLSWKILNETQQGDTATVEVEVTNKDFKAILNNLQQKVFKLALNGEDINNEKTEQYLLEELGNDEIGNVTSTCNITVNKQNGKWEVSEENDITNILLPGFDEAVNELY